MVRPQHIKLIVWIGIFLAVSYGIGQLTQNNIEGWYQALEKPALNPPNIIFPIVWSVLYGLIATAGWNLWRLEGNSITSNKVLYSAYVIMNWLWSPIFFGLHWIMVGFIWIMAINLINLAFILKTHKTIRLSAFLMIPPLLWTSFAAYLNFAIWLLNG